MKIDIRRNQVDSIIGRAIDGLDDRLEIENVPVIDISRLIDVHRELAVERQQEIVVRWIDPFEQED